MPFIIIFFNNIYMYHSAAKPGIKYKTKNCTNFVAKYLYI